MSELQYHPAANIFPLMEGEAFAELVEDIREHGLTVPILLYDSLILDGRNRYRACMEAGVEPHFRAYGNPDAYADITRRETLHGIMQTQVAIGMDDEGCPEFWAEWDGWPDDPIALVVSLNLKRRHLNESQRAMVAAKVAKMPRGGDREKQRANLHSASDAAEMLNVSERTVKSARKVQDKGTPELAAAVERGEVSVSAAAEIAERPQEEQREIVACGEAEIIKAANAIKAERKEKRRQERRAEAVEKAKAVPRQSDRYRIIHAAIEDLDIEPESVDWIITDPPYPEEFIPLYKTLAERSAVWLKPGGGLLAMCGQAFLPRVIEAICVPSLNYHWNIAYLMPGGQAAQIFPRKVNNFWKCVLWMVKGKYEGRWIGDVARSNVNDNDKQHHHWGQSESGMADLIERFTQPGDTILDPFLGGGTTGIVAVRLGRNFIGSDKDEEAVTTTLARLSEMRDATMVA